MNADEVWVVIKQRSPPYMGDWVSVAGVFATEVAAKAFIEEARKVREAWTVYDYDSWPVRGAPAAPKAPERGEPPPNMVWNRGKVTPMEPPPPTPKFCGAREHSEGTCPRWCAGLTSKEPPPHAFAAYQNPEQPSHGPDHDPGCYYLRSSDMDGDEAARCDCRLSTPPPHQKEEP